jgi:putative cell wall-binding protein
MTRSLRLLTLAVAFMLLAALPATSALADQTCRGTIGAESIDDNIDVPDAATCRLVGTQVGGNVIVGTGSTLVATGARVDGNVQLESNGGALRVTGNDVEGDVQAFSNAGGVAISDNTIGGNLQCKSNDPAPTGGDNIVGGNAEDQCANLSGGGGGGAPTTRETGRLAGRNRFETSVGISASQFPNGASVAYLARADAFADALSGGVLTDGPILLVPSCGQLPGVIGDEIRRLSPDRVIALGGGGAVCDDILDAAASV